MIYIVAFLLVLISMPAIPLVIPHFHVLTDGLNGKQVVMYFTETENAQKAFDREGFYLIGRYLGLRVAGRYYSYSVFDFEGKDKDEIKDMIMNDIMVDLEVNPLTAEELESIEAAVNEASSATEQAIMSAREAANEIVNVEVVENAAQVVVDHIDINPCANQSGCTVDESFHGHSNSAGNTDNTITQ